MLRFRRLYTHFRFAAQANRKRRLKVILKTVIWPWMQLAGTFLLLARHGRLAKKQSGRGLFLQWLDMLSMILNYCWPAYFYYFYRFFETDRRKDLPAYFLHHEISLAFDRLNGYADRQQLDDKSRFSELCARHGFITPTILARFENGQVIPHGPDQSLTLPDTDLFAKCMNSFGGRGAHRWHFQSPGQYVDHENKPFTAQGIIDFLVARTGNGDKFLLQPRVVNHPQLNAITNGSVGTSRIVTVRPAPGQAPQVVAAVVRLPHGKGITDNKGSSGIVCPVNHVDGTLGAGCHLFVDSPIYTHHPDTGAAIQGARLPDWEKAVAMCLAAHEKIWPHPGVGWDVAFTPQGPIFLEGNRPFGMQLMQRPHGKPLGNTLLLDAMLWGFDAPPSAPPAQTTRTDLALITDSSHS